MQRGNRSKMSLPIFGEIIRQTTVVIWWMILYNHTKLWGCNMSLEGHFLDSHLDFLPQKFGAVSDKHEE